MVVVVSLLKARLLAGRLRRLRLAGQANSIAN